MKLLHDAWNEGRRAEFETTVARAAHLPDPEQTDANGRTALWLAAAVCAPRAVERLLAEGADIEHRCPATGYTPLHAAAVWGEIDVAKCLLEHGANPDARDHSLQTPLIVAAIHGNSEQTKLLIEHGALVNLQDRDGFTALMIAARRRRTAIVRRLLASGADPNVQDESGATALMRSANREIFRCLLDAGSDVGLRDREGRRVGDWMRSRPAMLALLEAHAGGR